MTYYSIIFWVGFWGSMILAKLSHGWAAIFGWLVALLFLVGFFLASKRRD